MEPRATEFSGRSRHGDKGGVGKGGDPNFTKSDQQICSGFRWQGWGLRAQGLADITDPGADKSDTVSCQMAHPGNIDPGPGSYDLSEGMMRLVEATTPGSERLVMLSPGWKFKGRERRPRSMQLRGRTGKCGQHVIICLTKYCNMWHSVATSCQMWLARRLLHGARVLLQQQLLAAALRGSNNNNDTNNNNNMISSSSIIVTIINNTNNTIVIMNIIRRINKQL